MFGRTPRPDWRILGTTRSAAGAAHDHHLAATGLTAAGADQLPATTAPVWAVAVGALCSAPGRALTVATPYCGTERRPAVHAQGLASVCRWPGPTPTRSGRSCRRSPRDGRPAE